ncbi:cytokine receptor-like factor 3 isoform X2 [Hyalella azteca]|uniref:Cytokine receptor-like factor 3 isoform X2 n=1 Tax=Hyalella azteca TaxID=294128 RepID=A0A979FT16_HYAAZ|nr:cytokine receptor-like factor 3 isoform X2 [Hyalella azteca]
MDVINIVSYKEEIKAKIQEDLQDSISHLQRHNDELLDLLKSLLLAENQVTESLTTSRKQVKESCSKLRQLLLEVVSTREQELLAKLEQVEEEALSPLLDCKKLLSESLRSSQELLEHGQVLSSEAGRSYEPGKHSSSNTHVMITKESISKFQKQAALRNCLPSVPDLHGVVSVSVTFTASIPALLTSLLQQYGEVRWLGPVQITSVFEKPGALMVHWEEISSEVDDDEGDEEQREFVLQCSGADEELEFAHYRTVYTGPDDSFLLQQLCTGAKYWLRVAHLIDNLARTCKVCGAGPAKPVERSTTTEVCADVCAWSLPRQSSTSLPHYRWGDSEDWRVADDGRLATKVNSSASVLCSAAAQVMPGYSISLQIVSGNEGCCDEGMAISWQALASPDALTAPGTIFLSATGSVIVDGDSRSMKLPCLSQGSVVTVIVEPTSCSSRLRVHTETGGKRVTYDWPVPEKFAADPRLYFCACFSGPAWAVRVF